MISIDRVHEKYGQCPVRWLHDFSGGTGEVIVQERPGDGWEALDWLAESFAYEARKAPRVTDALRAHLRAQAVQRQADKQREEGLASGELVFVQCRGYVAIARREAA